MTDELFTSTEDAERPPAQDDDRPLGANDHVDLREWWKDLTYKEVHAFVVGFAPPFVALVLTALGYTGMAGTLWTLTLLVFGVAYGTKKLAGTLNRTMRYIVPEPHYAAGGAVLGILTGTPLMGLISLMATPAGGAVVSVGAIGALLYLAGGSVKQLADRYGWLP